MSTDKGVDFVLENYRKTLNLFDKHPEYRSLRRKVLAEFARVKTIKSTGNMYEHFLPFKSGENPHASEFAFLSSYGILPNEKLADYLAANFPAELSHHSGIGDLVPGGAYTGNEIVTTFAVSPQGGMRRSKKKNVLVLTAIHTNPLYDDKWTDGGILNYTGMGQSGDQSIDFMQNKTLAESVNNGVKVYLFESYNDKKYIYQGEVMLAGNPFYDYEIGADGKKRKVVKFPLKKVDGSDPAIVDIDDVAGSEDKKVKAVKGETEQTVAKKAKELGTPDPHEQTVTTIFRERNPWVAENARLRSKGKCDLCGCEAPFQNGGKPYLECHHVITLADGGPDTVYNTVALCPNCHRKIHVLHLKSDNEKLQKKIEGYLKADSDAPNLSKFKDLFKK